MRRYLEIFNEHIHDLLVPPKAMGLFFGVMVSRNHILTYSTDISTIFMSSGNHRLVRYSTKEQKNIQLRAFLSSFGSMSTHHGKLLGYHDRGFRLQS